MPRINYQKIIKNFLPSKASERPLPETDDTLNKIKSAKVSSESLTKKKKDETDPTRWTGLGPDGNLGGEGIEVIQSYFTLPKMLHNVGEKLTIDSEGKVETTLSWNMESSAFLPTESEKKLTKDGLVTEQFDTDLNRADYFVELPGEAPRQLERSTSQKEKIDGILIPTLGKKQLRTISEIAHQGHMADFISLGYLIVKNQDQDQYLLFADSEPPKFLIKKNEDKSCDVISTNTFQVRNSETLSAVQNLTVEMQRKNTLCYDAENKMLIHDSVGKKDGILIKIKYIISHQSGSFISAINNAKV